MQVIFKTSIDKFVGKFPKDFKIVPRVGEFVSVLPNSNTPFSELQVVKVSYKDSGLVLVELYLSELQAKENIAYNLKVFGN